MDSVYMQDFDIEKFVSMVREHSFIYDPRDPKHCNRYIISASWKNIAMEMNSTGKKFPLDGQIVVLVLCHCCKRCHFYFPCATTCCPFV